MEEKLNLVQKLAKIRSIADVVAKDKKGYNYHYADITEILAKVTGGMKKYNVSLYPSIEPGSAHVEPQVITSTKTDKSGQTFNNTTTEMLVSANMVFTWVDDDNPDDTMSVNWFVVGSQSDPSQAFGSAITYCTRYFLTSFFQIAQPDLDVDAYRSKQKEAEASEDRAVAEEIISTFDSTLKSFLADHPEKKDEAQSFVSRYAKNARYTSIKDPQLAGKLLNDFKSNFLGESKEV